MKIGKSARCSSLALYVTYYMIFTLRITTAQRSLNICTVVESGEVGVLYSILYIWGISYQAYEVYLRFYDALRMASIANAALTCAIIRGRETEREREREGRQYERDSLSRRGRGVEHV